MIQSTRRSNPSSGFSSVELMVAVTVSLLGIALASGLMLAGKSHIVAQERELETTQGAQASLIAILRELRLGGACLPETGEFIALDAVENGTRDQITTRYGLTHDDDLSCLQTTADVAVAAGDDQISVANADGFEAGMKVYIRHTNGSGEYFVVSTVDTTNHKLGADRIFAASYPTSSGVYAIDERRFYLADGARGAPELMIQIGDGTARSFAIGIEALDIQYELSNGTILDQPVTDPQWRSVSEVLVSVTARSFHPTADGSYYRRTYSIGVNPRNLVDS